jgi:hypothetical protein
MFKGSIKQRKHELQSYKSFKHFSEQEFFKELQGMNFNNISKHEDLDEQKYHIHFVTGSIYQVQTCHN